jgi:hypothetical protein
VLPERYDINLYKLHVTQKKVDRLGGLEFLATDPEVRVRFLALPDFLERGPLCLPSTI